MLVKLFPEKRKTIARIYRDLISSLRSILCSNVLLQLLYRAYTNRYATKKLQFVTQENISSANVFPRRKTWDEIKEFRAVFSTRCGNLTTLCKYDTRLSVVNLCLNFQPQKGDKYRFLTKMREGRNLPLLPFYFVALAPRKRSLIWFKNWPSAVRKSKIIRRKMSPKMVFEH